MENNPKKEILVAKNLNKIYSNGQVETHAVKDVSFTIYEGECIIFLGPSGSGKTTFMNLIGGMDRITSGELYYKEEAIHDFTKKDLSSFRRRIIGFIFQFYNLLPSLNCYENVALTADLNKNALPVTDIIEKAGLAGREKHFPSQLSGALDSETSTQVLKLLQQINKEYNKTVIVISHDTELLEFADRFFEIRDGKLIEKDA